MVDRMVRGSAVETELVVSVKADVGWSFDWASCHVVLTDM